MEEKRITVKSNEKNKKLSRVYMYIIYFFVFAFLGWIMESCYCAYVMGYFSKRGFLYGPICPIYGYGALILIIVLSRYKKNGFKLFTYSIIIFSFFEYAVSFALDALYGAKWWDYSERVMNINGRISIFHSFAWGVIAIVFFKSIYPFIKKHINIVLSKIPYKVQLAIVYLLCSVLVVDTVLSCIKYVA